MQIFELPIVFYPQNTPIFTNPFSYRTHPIYHNYILLLTFQNKNYTINKILTHNLQKTHIQLAHKKSRSTKTNKNLQKATKNIRVENFAFLQNFTTRKNYFPHTSEKQKHYHWNQKNLLYHKHITKH